MKEDKQIPQNIFKTKIKKEKIDKNKIKEHKLAKTFERLFEHIEISKVEDIEIEYHGQMIVGRITFEKPPKK